MTAFSDAGFDPKAWVNKALRSQASDNSKSADVRIHIGLLPLPLPPFLLSFFTDALSTPCCTTPTIVLLSSTLQQYTPTHIDVACHFFPAPLKIFTPLTSTHTCCSCGFFRGHPIRSRRRQPPRWMQDYASQVVMKLQMFIQGVTTEPVNQ